MGYYTVFRMGDVDPPEMAPTIKARLCELSGYGSPFGEDRNPADDSDGSPPWVKWYAWREHCIQVSVENLWVTFTVHGAGEDGSRWASTWSSADEVSHVVEHPGDDGDTSDIDTVRVRWTDAVYGGTVFAFPTSTRGELPDAWGPSVSERAWPVLADAASLGVPHEPAIPGAWTDDPQPIVVSGRGYGRTAAKQAWAGKSNAEILADIVQMGRRPGKTALGSARAAGAVSKRDQASARKWWRG